VVPLKAVAALAVGRALVTGDTPAARELLAHGENAWLVPPADPDALAAAIRILADRRELRETLGARGRQVYLARLSPPALGRALKGVFEALIEERRGAVAVV
jgi:glycosyltransferase involved in cell wall biosynthesis